MVPAETAPGAEWFNCVVRVSFQRMAPPHREHPLGLRVFDVIINFYRLPHVEIDSAYSVATERLPPDLRVLPPRAAHDHSSSTRPQSTVAPTWIEMRSQCLKAIGHIQERSCSRS